MTTSSSSSSVRRNTVITLLLVLLVTIVSVSTLYFRSSLSALDFFHDGNGANRKTSVDDQQQAMIVSSVFFGNGINNDDDVTRGEVLEPWQQENNPRSGQQARCELDNNFHSSCDYSNPSVNARLAFKLPMYKALRHFRGASLAEIEAPEAAAPCLLLVTHTRNCNIWRESLGECICRFGGFGGADAAAGPDDQAHGNDSVFSKILPESRCLNTTFWKDVLKKAPQLRSSVCNNKRKLSHHHHHHHHANHYPRSTKAMQRGIVLDSQTQTTNSERDTARPTCVPPSRRHYAKFPPPRKCPSISSSSCTHYAIGFALSESTFVKSVPRHKVFDWMPLLPKSFPPKGRYHVSLTDEDFFFELHSASFFAFTARRAGWDCLRHHDIISAGSVPFFVDLDRAPLHSIGHLPRDLLLKAMKLPGVSHLQREEQLFKSSSQDPFFEDVPISRVGFHNPLGSPIPGNIIQFRKPGEIDFSAFNVSAYFELADEILSYSRKHVTAAAVAAYMLKIIGNETPKRVLYVGRRGYDYLEWSIITGLGDLGISTTVVTGTHRPQMWKMKEQPPTRKQRDEFIRSTRGTVNGAGFGFLMRMADGVIESPMIELSSVVEDSSPNNDPQQQEQNALQDSRAAFDPEKRRRLIDRITSVKEFDVIIYTITHHSFPFLDEGVRSGARLAFVDTRDWHVDPPPELVDVCELGPVFIREMSDRPCRYGNVVQRAQRHRNYQSSSNNNTSRRHNATDGKTQSMRLDAANKVQHRVMRANDADGGSSSAPFRAKRTSPPARNFLQPNPRFEKKPQR